MKFFLAVIMALFSLSAVAGSGYFYGQGTATHPDGSVHPYLMAINIEKASDVEMKFSYDMQYADRNVTFGHSWVFAKAGDMFFDVIIDGEVVGNGYCFRQKACHMRHRMFDMWIENTLYFDRHKRMAHSIGSRSTDDGDIVYVWKEQLKKLR